jgi:hypothetical protein
MCDSLSSFRLYSHDRIWRFHSLRRLSLRDDALLDFERSWISEGSSYGYPGLQLDYGITVIVSKAPQAAPRIRHSREPAKGAQFIKDAIRRDEDGTIVVARHRSGRPRKSHTGGRKQDLYSLYVAASRETWPEIPVRVELHYLTTGETLDATPTERVAKNRIDNFREHVRRAKAGHYPANPGQQCKNCPWNLVCPSSV